MTNKRLTADGCGLWLRLGWGWVCTNTKYKNVERGGGAGAEDGEKITAISAPSKGMKASSGFAVEGEETRSFTSHLHFQNSGVNRLYRLTDNTLLRVRACGSEGGSRGIGAVNATLAMQVCFIVNNVNYILILLNLNYVHVLSVASKNKAASHKMQNT